ncbi:MAG: hypothetical protein MK235_02565 [Candidatus Poseidoniales archaeon]|nr:hypothetical protein [Candidatus Poseidoniales archaeon]
MSDGSEPSEDEVIRERKFRLQGGIDLSSFLGDDGLDEATVEPVAPSEPEQQEKVEDVAMGEVYDPFADGPRPGDVQRDGTVRLPPEMDTITEFATTGEKRLHWGLMVSMIVVYSAVGFILGTYDGIPPLVGMFSLLGLALFGFWLGERWVPDPGMHILGVTWVIITMKLLYGLTIDLHHWELWGIFPIDATTLGLLLLALVVLNVLVAYHHDHDAIAAQATLVLLAIGSGAGAVYGELGVAAGIIVATLLLHGLALHRKSGNLAALGVAASNIWIGLHAFSQNWSIGALTLVRFEDPLLLFLLLTGVNALNATMATRFAREENWFSQGLSLIGLGKPGLWSVSIGLAMIGALLAISSHRVETSYSLGMVTMLLATFGGSYLVVRGVESWRVLRPLSAGIPMLLLLVIIESGALSGPFGLDGYDVFTTLAAALTAYVLLSNQAAVSDHVLWIGSIVMVLLLTILVPSSTTDAGGDGGLLLLGALAAVHLGTAILAILRRSPSLAGVTVLTPWLWTLAVTLWAGGARTFNAAKQVWELDSGIVGYDGWVLVGYLVFATLLQYPVNRRLGDTGVNLAARLVGLSEMGARLRDSGLTRLWNLGFIVALVVWLAASKPETMPGYGLLIGMAALLLVHIGAHCEGRHQDNPRTLFILWGISAAWLQWKFGLDAAWMLLTTAAGVALVVFDDKPESESRVPALLTLMMGLLALQATLFSLDQLTTSLLDGNVLTSPSITGWVLIGCVSVSLGLYLPRAGHLEELLKPAAAAVVMLFTAIRATSQEGMLSIQLLLAGLLFVLSGVWLAAQGEIRSELKVVGRRSAREDKLRRLQMVQDALSEQELVGRPEQLLLKGGEAETGDTLLDLAELDSVPASDLLPATPAPGSPAPAHASMRTYHFTDEDLASRAADAVGEELARNLSQAVSTGNVTVIAPELYELAEKQKKRAKRSGASGTHDLMFGDIHHRPVVVMTFIAGVLLFAAWNAYAAGAAASGILALASVICLLLIFISRWRASSNELTLPDVMGMETPFALTMVGLSVVHFVGRQAPGSRMVVQLDLMVLIAVLVLLAGISLIGRRDLAMRIPSALEWIVYCLLGSRIGGAILAGSMPMPLLTNPFAFDSEITWTGAWLLLEGVLFGIVVLWDWIEGMRSSRGLPDARGAAGRGGWVVMITLLSFGPAALLAIGLGLRRAFQWSQPAAAALDVLAIAGAWLALAIWLVPISTLPWALIGLGLLMLAATAVTIPMRAQRWTAAWSWNAHGLLLFGLLLLFKWVTPFMSVALLALSLTIWVAGILQLRRSLRIWGAADLVLAIVAGLLSIQTVVDPIGLLLMLIALGIVLGIVAWLGQRYEGQLAVD